MKKIVYAILFLIFFFNSPFASAQEATPSITPVPTPVEYQLPYPGLLPDHPFYFLKNLRDSAMSFLISSPLKKAEFYLLQSDKNLQAAFYLYNQGKDSKIIFKTLQESENYFKKAIDKTNEAKKQGINTSDFSPKIVQANLKHQEVVLNLSKSAKDADRKEFEKRLMSLKILAEKAKELTK